MRDRNSQRSEDCDGLVQAELLAAHFAGEYVQALAVFDDGAAVDQHGFHSGRVALHFLGVDRSREFLADQIVDLIGIEDRDVRRQPFAHQTAVEAQLFRRISR